MRSCESRRTAEAPRRKDPRIQAGFVIPESILKCLVAFANTGGGIVVIGVEDGSKNVRGVPDVLAAEEKLANLVSDSIRLHLGPDIEVVPWRNLNVLAVQVYPSNTRPHYLERLGPQDGVFIRVGSTNRKADALQIDELKRLNWMNSFDEQAIPDLKSEAIDFRAASESFAPYRQMTAQAWTTLRIITERQGLTRESIIEGVRAARIPAKKEPSTFAACAGVGCRRREGRRCTTSTE